MRSNFFYSLLTLSLLLSCSNNVPKVESRSVTDSVHKMISGLVNDLSNHGAVAWLNYFEESSDFYMVSDGKIAFKDYQSAKNFINDTLARLIVKINLQLSNLRIDSLNETMAFIGADFHEDLTDSAAKLIRADGFVTALVKQTEKGWKFRNLQWSLKAPH